MGKVKIDSPGFASRARACEALGVSRSTFFRRYASIFTPYRTPGGGKRAGHVKVYADELAAAVEYQEYRLQVAAVHSVRDEKGRLHVKPVNVPSPKEGEPS